MSSKLWIKHKLHSSNVAKQLYIDKRQYICIQLYFFQIQNEIGAFPGEAGRTVRDLLPGILRTTRELAVAKQGLHKFGTWKQTISESKMQEEKLKL